MNYGIKEIEEFKAPSGKPWLVIAVIVLAGIIIWQSVSLLKNRQRKPREKAPAEEVEQAAAARNKSVLPPVEPRTVKPEPEIKEPTKKPPVVLQAGPAPKVSASETLEQARALLKKGDRTGARKLLLAGLKGNAAGGNLADIEKLLGQINLELAFLPYDMPEKIDHVVERGDSLDKMSKKYGVTVESIQIGNALKNANLIKAGDHLRVLDADFSINVYKGTHELVLMMNGDFFKRYKVGLGKFDKTPLGTFEIYDRIVKPVWWRPDGKEIPFGHKENILGTRWMAIRATGETPPVKGYGIHGTWDESSIGKSESAGCVRMRNADVEELFNLVPLGTKVTILK